MQFPETFQGPLQDPITTQPPSPSLRTTGLHTSEELEFHGGGGQVRLMKLFTWEMGGCVVANSEGVSWAGGASVVSGRGIGTCGFFRTGGLYKSLVLRGILLR
jgi:hypothetical protein